MAKASHKSWVIGHYRISTFIHITALFKNCHYRAGIHRKNHALGAACCSARRRVAAGSGARLFGKSNPALRRSRPLCHSSSTASGRRKTAVAGGENSPFGYRRNRLAHLERREIQALRHAHPPKPFHQSPRLVSASPASTFRGNPTRCANIPTHKTGCGCGRCIWMR